MVATKGSPQGHFGVYVFVGLKEIKKSSTIFGTCRFRSGGIPTGNALSVKA